ncbi:MAG: TIGR03915 family putative DNA repair protein [Clostridiaceae bacterium]|jgi:probable DNA metabolism protein|nr:TIGR03915 family putative DNA repair protein [Clostridiaceae bacterium]
MKVLVCQPNLVGFLSAIHAFYYDEKDAQLVVSENYARNLMDEYIEVDENADIASKVRGGIISKGGTASYEDVCDAYRSCNPDKENIIFEFLKLLFKHGANANLMFGEGAVTDFNDVLKKVVNEIHRMHMFVRFNEMSNGAYYAFYTSDNDILERIVPHFTQTYNTQPFILHDYTRRKMAVYDGSDTAFLLAPEKLEVELSERELFFQDLWKIYHNSVAIADRKNLKLQRQFLPKKYRHFMNEF